LEQDVKKNTQQWKVANYIEKGGAAWRFYHIPKKVDAQKTVLDKFE